MAEDVVDLGEVEFWLVIYEVVCVVKEVLGELPVVVVEYKVLDAGLVVVEGQLGVGDVAEAISQCREMN